MRAIGTIAGLALAVLIVGSLQAQTGRYPNRPVRVVVPYAPGGGTDVFARRLVEQMSIGLGERVFVENIGGAGGIVGMQQVAKADPDGYTLVLGLSAQFAVNVSLYPKLPYDPAKGYEPISLLASAPYVLVVHPSLAVHSVKELIALAKKEPRKLSYASAGNGSGAHLSAELLKTMTGIDMVHVPYKGAGPAYPDLLGGRVPVMFSTYAPITGHLEAQSLRALGVTTARRVAALPELPAISEEVPGYESDVWYAIAAPARTPKEIIARLNQEVLRALGSPAIREQLANDAIEPIGSTPEELRLYIPREIAKWAEVVKAAGAHLD